MCSFLIVTRKGPVDSLWDGTAHQWGQEMRGLGIFSPTCQPSVVGDGQEHWKLRSVKTVEEDLRESVVTTLCWRVPGWEDLVSHTPKFAISQAAGWIASAPHLQLLPEAEAVLWGWAPCCGVYTNSLGVSVRMELTEVSIRKKYYIHTNTNTPKVIFFSSEIQSPWSNPFSYLQERDIKNQENKNPE